MVATYNPAGFTEMKEIAKGIRGVEEIPKWAAYNRRIVFGRHYYYATSPRSGEGMVISMFIGEAAVNDRLDVVKHFWAYIHEHGLRAVTVNDDCIVAMHWRAFRCWGYLRSLNEPKSSPSPLFDAITTLDEASGTFEQLIKDGYCDIEERNDQDLTPLGFSAFHARGKHAEVLYHAGGNIYAKQGEHKSWRCIDLLKRGSARGGGLSG